MAEKTSGGLHYPLTKMNFLVTVSTVTEGVAAFSEVTGVEASVDVIEFRQGNSNSLAPVKIPGLVKHGNVTLKFGYTRNNAFKDWLKDMRGRAPHEGCPRHRDDRAHRHPRQLPLFPGGEYAG